MISSYFVALMLSPVGDVETEMQGQSKLGLSWISFGKYVTVPMQLVFFGFWFFVLFFIYFSFLFFFSSFLLFLFLSCLGIRYASSLSAE